MKKRQASDSTAVFNFSIFIQLGPNLNGGESRKVGEHHSCLLFDFEVYPEPKILTREDLKPLLKVHRNTVALAKFLGCSQAFVWERLNPYRNKPVNKSKKLNKGGK